MTYHRRLAWLALWLVVGALMWLLILQGVVAVARAVAP